MIRKNSWHYKLISKFGVPKTKVGYWSVLLPACLAYSIPYFVLMLIAFLAGFAGQDLVGQPFDNLFFDWCIGFVASVAILAASIFGIICGLFTIGFFHDKIFLPTYRWFKKNVKFKEAHYE